VKKRNTALLTAILTAHKNNEKMPIQNPLLFTGNTEFSESKNNPETTKYAKTAEFTKSILGGDKK